MTRMFRGVLAALAAVAVSLTGVNQPPVNAQARARWTILIFMNGDNNLEPDALINFQQLADVGGNADVNVVVQFDRIGKYQMTTPNWSQTLRFLVKKGTQALPKDAVQDIGEANMGDGQVLADFVRWGQTTYPADHYMLVIWDHGQGWRLFMTNLLQRQRTLMQARSLNATDTVQGFRAMAVQLRNGSGVAAISGETAPFRSAPGDSYRSASNDETDKDVLYNREIEDALRGVVGAHPLDVIGFDACLMSMVETAYAFRDVARYLVASEELEPGLGWDYRDWLSRLVANPQQDAAAVARLTVDSYRATYTKKNPDPETTMAAIELGKVTPLAATVTALGDLLTQKIAGELQNIVEARAATHVYAPGYGFYHVDLSHFAGELARRTSDSGVKAAASALSKAVSDGVVANYAGADRQGAYGSNGLAIYFPDSNSQHTADAFSEGGYEKDNTFFPVEFVQREHWADFLHAFWSRVP